MLLSAQPVFSKTESSDRIKAYSKIIADALSSEDRSTRNEAVRLLPGLKDKTFINQLKNLLNSDIDDTTKVQVAATLYRLGDTVSAQVLADVLKTRPKISPDAKPLERAKAMMKDNTRINVVRIMGDLGEKGFIPLLKRTVKDGTENGRVVDQAYITLGKLGDMNENIDIFNSGLDSTDLNIKRQSCIALGEIKESSSTGKIAQLLNHFDRDVRSQAAIAIGKIGDKRYAPALVTLLTDKEPSVKVSACEALGVLGEPVVIPKLQEVSKDDNSMVKLSAAIALIKLGDYINEDIILRALESSDFDAKTKSIQVLTDYGKQLHVQSLEKAFSLEQTPMFKLDIANAIIQICLRELPKKGDKK
jgi:HEAT repeat protein